MQRLMVIFIALTAIISVSKGSSDNIDGGGWTLVRHAHNIWHPARDNLAGTDNYCYAADNSVPGDGYKAASPDSNSQSCSANNDPQSTSSWSIAYTAKDDTEFLFCNTDCSKWLITTYSEIKRSEPNSVGCNTDYTIKASSVQSSQYRVKWCNRQWNDVVYDEDPWISINNHASGLILLYGEANNKHHLGQVQGFVNINVYIRQQNVDECSEETDNCSPDAICIDDDEPTGFQCVCKAGYEGNGEICNDIDECTAETDDCDVNAQCINTAGGFDCQCDSGYEGDGKICSDINECRTRSDDCDAKGVSGAVCMNTMGSYQCKCVDMSATIECGNGEEAECQIVSGKMTCKCSVANANVIVLDYKWAISCVIVFIASLLINIVLSYQKANGRKGYAPVKYVESDSEAQAMIN